MARISIEDCLGKIPNRFSLVHLAAQRARQLARGSNRLVKADNGNIVLALREVAAKKVYFADSVDTTEFAS